MKNLKLLLLFSLLIIYSSGCRKSMPQPAAAIPKRVDSLARMYGARFWHGTSYGVNYILNDSGNFNTINYSNPITDSATITKIDNFTCRFFIDNSFGDNIVFMQNSIDTLNKVIYFHDNSPYDILIYYYAADSIHFEFHDMGVHTDNNRILMTP